MKKKLFVILIMFMFSLSLIACDKTSKSADMDISKEMFQENLDKEEPEKIPINSIISSSLNDYNIIQSAYAYIGLLIVSDTESKESVWSLFKGKLIFPLQEHIDISIIYYSSNYYVEVKTFYDETTVYDVYGNTVLPQGKYTTYSIFGTTKTEYDDEKEVENKIFYETVYYINTDNLIEDRKTYATDLDTRVRTEVDSEKNNYNEGFLLQHDLKDAGLPNHYITTIGVNTYVHKKPENENTPPILVNTIIMPDYDSYVLYNGIIFCQKSYLVDPESPDFTYVHNERKYKLVTKSINLLNGKEKNLYVNYLVSYGNPFKNEKGKVVYALLEVYEIVERNLSSNARSILVDNDGKIVKQLGNLNLLNIKKLNDNYYYNPTTRCILNENLEILYQLKSVPRFSLTDELIILEDNGYYGAIKYDGTVIIPFNYYSINNKFVDGKTFAIHKNRTNCIIDAFGEATELQDSVTLVSTNLLFISSFNQQKNTYEGKFVDYNNSVKYSFDYETSLGDYSIETAIGFYQLRVFRVQDNGVSKPLYVMVDITESLKLNE